MKRPKRKTKAKKQAKAVRRRKPAARNIAKRKTAGKHAVGKRGSRAFVYVLGCVARDRHWTYVGWTNDLEQRLARHNAGKGARSTRGRIWTLLHIERFRTREAAMSREWNLKRDRKFRKILAQRMLDDAAHAGIPERI